MAVPWLFSVWELKPSFSVVIATVTFVVSHISAKLKIYIFHGGSPSLWAFWEVWVSSMLRSFATVIGGVLEVPSFPEHPRHLQAWININQLSFHAVVLCIITISMIKPMTRMTRTRIIRGDDDHLDGYCSDDGKYQPCSHINWIWWRDILVREASEMPNARRANASSWYAIVTGGKSRKRNTLLKWSFKNSQVANCAGEADANASMFRNQNQKFHCSVRKTAWKTWD